MPLAGAAGRRRWIEDGGTCLVRAEDRYRRRFEPFAVHCREPLGLAPYPLDPAEQFGLYHWPDLNLLVLGLNSAWEIDHHHRDRAGLHPEAISRALDALRARPDWAATVKIAVWHHPLASAEPSRITDHGFVERLARAGFRVGLHGHIHKAETALYRYELGPTGRRVDLCAAGTFGASSRDWVPGYPLQYNLLRLSAPAPGGRITVETRCRAEPNGAWRPDARWPQPQGRDPLPRYVIDL